MLSPKIRGCPHGRGRSRPKRPASSPVRPLRLSDQVLRSGGQIVPGSAFDAEGRASEWLGQAWATAGLSQRNPESELCTEIAARVSARPSPPGLAAVAAVLRLAPPSAQASLDQALAEVAERFRLPAWSADPAQRAVAAWRSVDVWDSERVLFLDYPDGPRPHTLFATVDDVLTELAEALQRTDITWPRTDDEDVVRPRRPRRRRARHSPGERQPTRPRPHR